MSLINNMLKDLEQRQNGSTQPNLHILTPVDNAPRKVDYKAVLLTSALILVSIIFLSSFSLNKHQYHTAKFLPYAPQNPFDATTLHNFSENQLSNIRYTQKENQLMLILQTTQENLFHINSNKQLNQFNISLENTSPSSSLKMLSQIPGVKNISFVKEEDNLKINFELEANAKLIGIDTINVKKGQHQINIDLKITQPHNSVMQQSKTTSIINTKIASTIKHPSKDQLLTTEYLTAINDIKLGRIHHSITALNQILKSDPEFHDARTTLVALLLQQNNHMLALQEINNGLKLNPDYLPFIELKARLLVNENKLKQALILLKTSSPEMAKHADYYSLLAAVYEKLNDNELAAQTYQMLVKHNPHNGAWWMGLGISLEKLNKPISAANAYRHALTDNNLDHEALNYVQHQLNTIEDIS